MDEVRLYAPGARRHASIPVTLVYRKTTRLTGDNPTLLVGYGATARTLSPTFDPARLAWLERGGVLRDRARARRRRVRRGVAPRPGAARTKVNTILDFIAVAEFLVALRLHQPEAPRDRGRERGRHPRRRRARAPARALRGGGRARAGDGHAALRASAQRARPTCPSSAPRATREGVEALRVMSAYHHVKDGTRVSGGAAHRRHATTRASSRGSRARWRRACRPRARAASPCCCAWTSSRPRPGAARASAPRSSPTSTPSSSGSSATPHFQRPSRGQLGRPRVPSPSRRGPRSPLRHRSAL